MGLLRLDWNLLFTVINLLILYFIVSKFLLKPVRKILDARQAEIENQYGDAQKVQDAAEEMKKQYEASLGGIEEQKAEIINEARGRAGAEYEKIVGEARQQADRLMEDAARSAKEQQDKRMQQAQEEIAELVVAATAKLVASRQDAAADRELYNQFLAKTGEKSE